MYGNEVELFKMLLCQWWIYNVVETQRALAVPLMEGGVGIFGFVILAIF